MVLPRPPEPRKRECKEETKSSKTRSWFSHSKNPATQLLLLLQFRNPINNEARDKERVREREREEEEERKILKEKEEVLVRKEGRLSPLSDIDFYSLSTFESL
jgi:hypothetical protein